MSKPKRLPDQVQQQLLEEVRVRLAFSKELPRIVRLLEQHHYLGNLRPVGQRLDYMAANASGQWVAILVFSAPAKHLKHRDPWIGWDNEPRRRRLSLITDNSRFLLLPGAPPDLGSRILRLTRDRLSRDWQARYGHPVLAVETFVDPEQFCGTVYTAGGWKELGQTDGWGRTQRDYHVKHNKPKRLFVRALRRNACRHLQAARLLRQTQGREDENVALISSAAVSLLPAMLWRGLNRKAWGIESGLHQRRDVSCNDDRCRVQSDNGIWVLGMFRRIANSLFVQWSSGRRRPDQVTTTTFQTLMAENHRAAALRFVLSKRPTLKTLSYIGAGGTVRNREYSVKTQ
jgi:Druantia protein DruA